MSLITTPPGPVLADIEWQGRPAQGDDVGESERRLLRSRSRNR